MPPGGCCASAVGRRASARECSAARPAGAARARPSTSRPIGSTSRWRCGPRNPARPPGGAAPPPAWPESPSGRGTFGSISGSTAPPPAARSTSGSPAGGCATTCRGGALRSDGGRRANATATRAPRRTSAWPLRAAAPCPAPPAPGASASESPAPPPASRVAACGRYARGTWPGADRGRARGALRGDAPPTPPTPAGSPPWPSSAPPLGGARARRGRAPGWRRPPAASASPPRAPGASARREAGGVRVPDQDDFQIQHQMKSQIYKDAYV
eukprot:1189303-Prorocentrum_minimum.AAC.4